MALTVGFTGSVHSYTKVNNSQIYEQTRGYDTDEYRVFIGVHFVPITPSKITYSQEDRTETIYLASDSYLIVPHKDGPQTFSFDFRVPMHANENRFIYTEKPTGDAIYPFMTKMSVPSHQFWSDYLWNLKQEKTPINLGVYRHKGDTSMSRPVYLTDWSYVEDAEKGNDFIFSVTFTDYIVQKNQEIAWAIEQDLITSKNVRGWAGEGFPTEENNG